MADGSDSNLDPRWGAASIYDSYLWMTGTPVKYNLRRYLSALARIDTVETASLTDAGLRTRFDQARARASDGEPLDLLLPKVYAWVREACSRALGMRPFDVQVMAGVALHQRKLVQLATGEGKTLVAVLPAVLDALEGKGVHVLTANDYLARRDAEWMGPAYRFFGLRVGYVQQGMSIPERQAAYAADITYLTAKEAGFDYLRDHTVDNITRVVQRPFHFAIIDEADFILIDEARVPLVIAGSTTAAAVDHAALAELASRLRPGVDYRTDEYARNVVLTDVGFRSIEALLGRCDLHQPGNQLLLSAVQVALHAQALLQRDRDYIVRDGRVELVDEFTGRVAEDRRWPHGIQPAVEAKEGVEVRVEGKILGSIPIQHFVKLYPRIAGMTATAVPAADEFKTFYGLSTVVFPPNRPCRRVDEPDLVFSHRDAKMASLIEEITRVHGTGRPILVGTASVGESETLAAALAGHGIDCRVLNARHDAQEARIIARAGVTGAVTISTNMAGRGTDIVLGGGDEADRAQVVALGGLYVIGTNRHESRRIDDQLRGRAGRQGDPGSSQFYISLEDDLIRRYGIMELIPKGQRPERRPDPIADPVVRREIARAQRIIEGQNFDIRRTLWRYSALVDEQRRSVCERRQELLRDEIEPAFCEDEAPDHYEKLESVVGTHVLRHAENLLTMHLLDRHWSDHLALIEDIREGIHLQRYGGRQPLDEFHKQIVNAFGAMMEDVRSEAVAAFRGLSADGGTVALEQAGFRGPSSTWTYLVNDNPFSSFGVSLLASRNIGMSAAVGMLAVLYWPVTLAISAYVFLRRFGLMRRTRARAAK
jgi:preprotein translocase subunit SecA